MMSEKSYEALYDGDSLMGLEYILMKFIPLGSSTKKWMLIQ